MAVPTFIQSKTAASDAAAATSHSITPDSAIRSSGGAIGPSTLILMISYDGNSGNQVSSVTDTASNTWQRGTSASNSAGVNGEIWYAFNAQSGSVTITANMASSVKAKLAFAELDQVAPISPIDGTSTPFDKSTARIDTTSSSSRTSASTNSVKQVGAVEVYVGGIAWNDTRTISSAGSSWTGLVQLSGSASNLGVGIERKLAEVQNIAGSSCIARFTMSASGTSPAAVMCLSFFRDGVITSTDQDGMIDNVEGVEAITTNASPDFVYMSSASAPLGGTGGSEKSNGFAFFPRYYAPAGATIGENISHLFNVSDGFDEGSGVSYCYMYYWKDGELGSTLTSGDQHPLTATLDGYDWQEGAGLPVATGWHTLSVLKTNILNLTGVTNACLSEYTDAMGSTTNNYVNLSEYQNSSPQYLVLSLTYPSTSVPQRTMRRAGT